MKYMFLTFSAIKKIKKPKDFIKFSTLPVYDLGT